MRLFLQYLRGKAGKIAAFFLFAVIFIVSFALYHLPLAAVWYPSALCVILGLAVLLLDFRRVKARHETLRLILCQLPTLPETLPAAHTVPEEDYRALVQALCAQQQALETRMNAQYQDMLDYYTLWRTRSKRPSPPCAYRSNRRTRRRRGGFYRSFPAPSSMSRWSWSICG